MSRLSALVAVAVLGCTTEQAVLGFDVVTTCDAAWLAAGGTSCSFAGSCERPDPANAACCANTAYCANGTLVVDRSCNPDCTLCQTDLECTPGAAICTTGHCQPCPSTANCLMCPVGWARLERNGCPTCDCAPPPQCTPTPPGVPPPPPPPPSPCPPQEVCYPGKRCATGCAPGDDCCATTCSMPGCMGPAPVGCFMPCVNMPCNLCAADSCECGPGGWICTPRCLDNEPTSISCSV